MAIKSGQADVVIAGIEKMNDLTQNARDSGCVSVILSGNGLQV